MKSNVGRTDQIVRYVLAIIIILLSIWLENYWLLIPAIIIGFTAAVSWCAVYRIFGIDTTEENPADKT
ncbi:MAG: YgaP family membrane protein [Bacillota bacterium]